MLNPLKQQFVTRHLFQTRITLLTLHINSTLRINSHLQTKKLQENVMVVAKNHITALRNAKPGERIATIVAKQIILHLCATEQAP